jgi:nucleotide-binding universal stress UspA family protein
MFKHVLLPADTSPGSMAAARAGLAFAKQCGARATVVHVLPEFHLRPGASAPRSGELDYYQRDRVAQADGLLAELAAAARALELDCTTVTLHGDHTGRCLLDAAGRYGCDLIAMASHGELGVLAAMLGSVTHQVLVHSPVPVLVLRQ